MTEQEAIEILAMFLHKQCDLERTKFAYDANTVWEAVKMASVALEKQISLENILERLEEIKATCSGNKCEKDGCAGCVDCKIENTYGEAIEIIKEEVEE